MASKGICGVKMRYLGIVLLFLETYRLCRQQTPQINAPECHTLTHHTNETKFVFLYSSGNPGREFSCGGFGEGKAGGFFVSSALSNSSLVLITVDQFDNLIDC